MSSHRFAGFSTLALVVVLIVLGCVGLPHSVHAISNWVDLVVTSSGEASVFRVAVTNTTQADHLYVAGLDVGEFNHALLRRLVKTGHLTAEQANELIESAQPKARYEVLDGGGIIRKHPKPEHGR